MRLLSRAVALGAAVLLALSGAPAAGAPAADDLPPCDSTPPDQLTTAAGDGSLPALLDLGRAHEVATGRGVGVAVIDAGVSPGGAGAVVPVRSAVSVAGDGSVHDTHGTVVASLIAGRNSGAPIGVAPDAEIWSWKVYDAGPLVASQEEGWVGLEAGPVAAAVRAATRQPEVDVITLALNFATEPPVLRAAIREAVDAGNVVVASVGNRRLDETSSTVDPDDGYRVGEERVQFPATVRGVLGVSTAGADGRLDPQFAYTGEGLDVTAPVGGTYAVTVGGSLCAIETPWSSWGAAEVAGLAALVLEAHPGLTPAQVVARIEATAQGAVDSDALDGHGLVQPLEALTAELDIARDGRMVAPAAAREPRRRFEPADLDHDEFAASRRSLLWWGLGAGGALLAALLLRPLTARRRG